MRRGRRYTKDRRNISYRILSKLEENECFEIFPYEGEADQVNYNKSAHKLTKVLPESKNFCQNQAATKKKKHQGKTNKFLLEGISETVLSPICEDEDTQGSEETQRGCELEVSKHGRENTKKAFPVFLCRNENLPTGLSIKDQIDLTDTVCIFLGAAINNAQLTQNETEIEVVFENAGDFEAMINRPKEKINFLQKTLLNISCTKHRSVKMSSVLARITVHVVPPKLTVSDNYLENLVSKSQEGSPHTQGSSYSKNSSTTEKRHVTSQKVKLPGYDSSRGPCEATRNKLSH